MAWKFVEDVAAANNAGNALDAELTTEKAAVMRLTSELASANDQLKGTVPKADLEAANLKIEGMVPKADLDTEKATSLRLTSELATANTSLQAEQQKSRTQAGKLGAAPHQESATTGLTDKDGNDKAPETPKAQGLGRLAKAFATQQPPAVTA